MSRPDMAKAPAKRKSSPPSKKRAPSQTEEVSVLPEIRVRRMHRRDLRRVWEFLKLVFRSVNRKTLEYQRPRSRQRFEEVYDDEGIEQLVFEVGSEIVGYAECAYEVTGSDNWINPRFFDARDMRPLFVEELASHPSYQGRGVGSFMLEQLRHLARVRGCTHLVLEVAENNVEALRFYRKRSFHKLDAAIFLAQKVDSERELLPPRPLMSRRAAAAETADEPGSLALSTPQATRPLRKPSRKRTSIAAPPEDGVLIADVREFEELPAGSDEVPVEVGALVPLASATKRRRKAAAPKPSAPAAPPKSPKLPRSQPAQKSPKTPTRRAGPKRSAPARARTSKSTT